MVSFLIYLEPNSRMLLFYSSVVKENLRMGIPSLAQKINESRKNGLLKLSRLFQFGCCGGTAFIVNAGSLELLARAGMNTVFLENIAFVIALELSILVNFFMQRHLTWKDTPRMKGKKLATQCLTFHAAVGVTSILRIALFPLGQMFGLHRQFNLIIGVALAAEINYLCYDLLVFKRKAALEE